MESYIGPGEGESNLNWPKEPFAGTADTVYMDTPKVDAVGKTVATPFAQLVVVPYVATEIPVKIVDKDVKQPVAGFVKPLAGKKKCYN